MGNLKAASQLHQPGVYRDEPDRDDAASTSSALLMGDIDYHEEPLPAYSDEPSLAIPQDHLTSTQEPSITRVAPDLPFSSISSDRTEIRTLFPRFSQYAESLESMIREQALYPPGYYVEIFGTHTETRKHNGKENKERVTDFHIQIDMTDTICINPGQQGSLNRINILPEGEKGYRGGFMKATNPILSAGELEEVENNYIRAWCEKFVKDKSSTKTFTLKRGVANHDVAGLEQLLRSLIASTNYRGHVSISFKLTQQRVTVYSPSRLNSWRLNTYIRWFFYLTFLWIFAWPVLFFMTKRYEVADAMFPYSAFSPEDVAQGFARSRDPLVMSEHAWFQRWEKAIRKGVLSRFNGKCKVLMDEEYRRIAELEGDRRNASGQVEAPRTGNAFADGALNLLAGGLQLAQDVTGSRGWGYDS